MAGIDYYQDPNNPNDAIIVYPQKGQTVKVVYGNTHAPGPDKDRDDCVVIRPKEQS